MADKGAFLSFVASLLGVDESSISLDTEYGSVPEWDSVMHLRLVMEIGDRFGARIPFNEIASVKTLGDFFSYLERC